MLRTFQAGEKELDAEPLRRLVGYLDDDRLDQHLLAPRVELADHFTETALHVLGSGDDDRIGALEAGDHRAAGAEDAGAAAPAGLCRRRRRTILLIGRRSEHGPGQRRRRWRCSGRGC
jgi:hypothetical protein